MHLYVSGCVLYSLEPMHTEKYGKCAFKLTDLGRPLLVFIKHL